MTTFAGWENFYVIVGSSAGALIGLQFVVITLIADFAGGENQAQAGSAFATPTVVHFGAVLLLAAIATVPWTGSLGPAAAVGTVGTAGLVYALIVIRRMRRQRIYRPEFEDWLFHAALPLGAYAMLLSATPGVAAGRREAELAIGAAAMGLLLIGIHNAWDAVTYHVFVSRRRHRERD